MILILSELPSNDSSEETELILHYLKWKCVSFTVSHDTVRLKELGEDDTPVLAINSNIHYHGFYEIVDNV